MTIVRKPGRMYVGLQVDAEMLEKIDSARGFKDRSQFVREAIAGKLTAQGITVPESLIYPPPRAKLRPFKYPKQRKKK